MSNLKKIRKEKELSQSQLAIKSDVPVCMIQKYEQGVKDINKAQVLTVYHLAQVLDVNTEDLIEK